MTTMRKAILLLFGLFISYASDAQLSKKDSLKVEKIDLIFQKGGENIIKAINKLEPIFKANEGTPVVWERMLKYKIAFYSYRKIENGQMDQRFNLMAEAARPIKLNEIIQLLKRATDKNLAIKDFCLTIKKIEELSIKGGETPNYPNTTEDIKYVKSKNNCD
jgi:hypothetical protein